MKISSFIKPPLARGMENDLLQPSKVYKYSVKKIPHPAGARSIARAALGTSLAGEFSALSNSDYNKRYQYKSDCGAGSTRDSGFSGMDPATSP